MKTQTNAEIIVVDDNAMNLKFLCEMLRESGYATKPARSGQLALQAARLSPPDLFLLDINMPGMNGYEVCAELKQDQMLREIPVIFISASGETFDKLKAFSVGGVDYVTKPFQYEEVQARIQTHLALDRQKREIEQLREQERSYYETISLAKDHVVQMASHDLKSPLAGIHLLVSLLKRTVTDNHRALGYVESIERSTERMVEIVTNVLDLARLETGLGLVKEKIALNSLLKQILHDFEPHAAAKEISMEFQNYETDFDILADAEHLRHVIENLLSNAINYTPAGGVVRLSLDKSNDEAIIHVTDTGVGIAPAEMARIFDRFYRVQGSNQEDESQVGSGLGLAIAKSIVEKHRGHIQVKSEINQGTDFAVFLPLEPRSAS